MRTIDIKKNIKVYLPLSMKIIGGYIFLSLFVLFVFVIIFLEKSRVHELQEIVVNINKERESINRVHLYMSRLASQSESIITWNISDFNKYQDYRLKVDSILYDMKSFDLKDTLRSEYIDSLRKLVRNKGKSSFSYHGDSYIKEEYR